MSIRRASRIPSLIACLPAALFIPDGGGYLATELCSGPWDPGAQHGGAPAALLAGAFDALGGGEGLVLARISLELLRPVPLERLFLSADVARAGRRVQLLEGAIHGPDGRELVRARALRVAPAAAAARAEAASTRSARRESAPMPWPGRAAAVKVRPGGRQGPMFPVDAVELRFVDGDFLTPGPASTWFRLRVPVVEGCPISPLSRVAAAADFGNGIANAVPWDAFTFINPDLTIVLDRLPAGEWIGLRSHTRIGEGGIGVAESELHDEGGRLGTALQTLVVSAR